MTISALISTTAHTDTCIPCSKLYFTRCFGESFTFTLPHTSDFGRAKVVFCVPMHLSHSKTADILRCFQSLIPTPADPNPATVEAALGGRIASFLSSGYGKYSYDRSQEHVPCSPLTERHTMFTLCLCFASLTPSCMFMAKIIRCAPLSSFIEYHG